MLYWVHKGKAVDMPIKDYIECRLLDLILDYPLRWSQNRLTDYLAGLWHDRVWRKNGKQTVASNRYIP